MMSDPILGVRVEAPIQSLSAQLAQMAVLQLDGVEQLAQLYSLDVGLAFRPDELKDADGRPVEFDFTVLPGSEVTVVFTSQQASEPVVEVRRVHGIVASIVDSMQEWDGYTRFQLTIVPRMWNLGRVTASEVYLGKTVWEILDQVLGNFGLAKDKDYVFQYLPSPLYEPREFVLQYQETSLAFVMRLCEHHGIAFHFEHEDGVDRIVFSDTHRIYQKTSVIEAGLPFLATGKKTGVYRLIRTLGRFHRLVTVENYDYATARTVSGTYPSPTKSTQPYSEDALVGTPTDLGWGGLVEFGSNVRSDEEALALARVRYEEARSGAVVYEGDTDCLALFAGIQFEVTGHPNQVPKLVVTRLAYSARYNPFALADTEERRFAATFAAIAASRPFRPLRVTPKPRIAGVIAATIGSGVDPEIERNTEIDEKGRYRVRFKFDTLAPDDRAQGSHWIRMAQALAGPGYGWSFPLRKGVEVLVAFEDGDPDRPVISGALYHETAPNPVTAMSPTKNRLRTQSGVLFEIDDGSGT
jgi:type VI secretion system secreted protein VgrG